MKITIDTENKTITSPNKINVGELVEELKKLSPNNWKEWNIELGQKAQPSLPYTPPQPYVQNPFEYPHPWSEEPKTGDHDWLGDLVK